jgi:hypothetical protein
VLLDTLLFELRLLLVQITEIKYPPKNNDYKLNNCIVGKRLTFHLLANSTMLRRIIRRAIELFSNCLRIFNTDLAKILNQHTKTRSQVMDNFLNKILHFSLFLE